MSQVEAANTAFANSVEPIASQAASSLSMSGAQAALVTAIQQLEASYQKPLAPVNCD